MVEARAQLAARVDGLADSMTSIAGAGRDAQLVSESLGGVIRRLEEVWTRLDRLEEQLAALTRQGARRPASPADADRPANRIAYL
ncbi:hypothetical protein HS125_01330 [bacterium]|nr:hypothetical protein [bacterium]